MKLISIRIVAAAVLTVAAAIHPAAQSPPAAQTAPPAQNALAEPVAATATDRYRDEPLVFERLDTDTRMNADGTGTVVSRIVVRVQSEGTARNLSVLSLSFASATQTASYDFVRVHKKDGTTVETPVSDAMEMSSEVSRQAPVYSDIKEKHLPVRALSVGDTLDYQARVVLNKAEAPGQFWGGSHFIAAGAVVLQQAVTLSVPVDTYVQVYSPRHPATSVTRDGMKVWTWTSTQVKPSQRDENGKMTPADLKDPDTDADGRSLPSVAWTTFRSWEDVGKWYRGLIDPRAQPTPAVKAKADELTRDAQSPEAQVQAMYRFVATGIRYVGISFGVGRIQPHDAADVLANGYGDCKDKDTLFEALLRAKGFTTAPALIGAGIAPVVDLPSPTNFNHEITTVDLPGTGRIWLDTTAEVAPFRLLSPVIRDQEALVLPATGAATLIKTPADPPFAYNETFESVGTLSDKGVLKSHIVMTVRSDAEFAYRGMMQRISPSQWDEAMGYVSAGMNLGGKVSNADLRQDDPAGPVHMGFDYTREDFADWKNNRIFANFPTLEVVTLDKDKAPDYDIQFGAPRTLVARSTITVPEGDRMELPSAVHAERPYMTFDKKYRFSDGKFMAERTLVIKQRKLSKDQWKDYLAFAKEADFEDGEKYAVLIPSGVKANAGSAANDPAGPAEASRSAQALLDSIAAAERSRDWDTLRRLAQEGIAKYPEVERIHSWMAYSENHDRKFDEAIADYQAELKAFPEGDDYPVVQLANLLYYRKRYTEEVDLLKRYASRDTAQFVSMTVAADTAMGDHEAALAVLRDYLSKHPENRAMRTAEVQTLQGLHRNDEAAIAAKQALDGADDPNLINNNAYYLSQMKVDLPLAEESSRKSIVMFEKITSSGAVAEANTKAFAQSSQMVAAWDTLGYILLIENKPKDAEPYIVAAWFNAPDTVTGRHLMQVYEAEGRKAEALRVGRMAIGNSGTAKSTEGDEIKVAVTQMEKDGVVVTRKPTSLQEMRTFTIVRPKGISGSGIVRLQLGTGGICDLMLASGDAALKPLLNDIRKLSMPDAVPAGVAAKVLRDAVLYCGETTPTCDVVLTPTSGLSTEGMNN